MIKNPFSLFDFLGYVFPGAIAIFVFDFFNKLDVPLQDLTQLLSQIKRYISILSTYDLNLIVLFFIFVLLSYVVGHMIGYLSSITIEKFVVDLYGYPSSFLLRKKKQKSLIILLRYLIKKPKKICSLIINILKQIFNYKSLKERNTPYELIVSIIWKIVLCVILFPIVLCTIVLGWILRLNKFYVKELDKYLIDSIKSKETELKKELNLSQNDSNNADFHRIVDHFALEYCPNHMRKLDNYVAIYDFLRSITLILDLSFMYILFSNIYICRSEGCFCVSGDTLILLIAICLLTYIFFMSFIKFYRRYSLEGYMCIVIYRYSKNNDKIKFDFRTNINTYF